MNRTSGHKLVSGSVAGPPQNDDGEESTSYDRSDVSSNHKRGTHVAMRPHVSVITLGVRDLDRAKEFYSEGLGWPIQQEQDEWICFSLGNGSSALAL
jgi:hypothetical protein